MRPEATDPYGNPRTLLRKRQEESFVDAVVTGLWSGEEFSYRGGHYPAPLSTGDDEREVSPLFRFESALWS